MIGECNAKHFDGSYSTDVRESRWYNYLRHTPAIVITISADFRVRTDSNPESYRRV